MTKYTKSVPPYIKHKIPPARRTDIKEILEQYDLMHYNEFDLIKHGGFDVDNTHCKTRSTYNKHLFPTNGYYLKDYVNTR